MPPPSERRRSNRFRPLLEALELRDVPAICHWTGAVSSAFDNPLNWYGGVPQAGDNIVFEPYLEPAPPLEEPPPPPTYVSHPCTGMTGATGGDGSGAYNAVTLLGSYTSTVTLATSITTRAFILEGGTINQPATAGDTDITVIGGYIGSYPDAFKWTGGTLNGTTNLATVTITGGTTTGLIAPAGGGYVYLGSHISLESGAHATIEEGTINVTNDSWTFTVNDNCAVDVTGAGLAEFAGLEDEFILVKPNALWTVEQGRTFRANAKLTNQGTVTLKAGAIANFRGVQGDNVAYLQQSGITRLYGGSSLRSGFGNKVAITEGLLTTVVQDYTQSYNRTASIVTDKLEVMGGHVYINRFDGVPHSVFGTLAVSGDIDWTGGTYHPYVEGTIDGVNGGGSDVWQASGKITIGGTAAIAPVSIAIFDPSTVVEVTPISGYTWRILVGIGGIVPANNTPTLDGNVWEIEIQTILDASYWYLKAK